MSIVNHTLNEFGKTIGLDDLSFPETGTVSLQIEQMGTLFFEQASDEVLVYLTRPLPPFSDTALQTALNLCHYEQGHQVVVQAGLRGDDLLAFLARIPAHEFTMPAIDRSISLLEKLHDTVTAQ